MWMFRVTGETPVVEFSLVLFVHSRYSLHLFFPFFFLKLFRCFASSLCFLIFVFLCLISKEFYGREPCFSLMMKQVGSPHMAEPTLRSMAHSLLPGGFMIITGFTTSFLTPDLLGKVEGLLAIPISCV